MGLCRDGLYLFEVTSVVSVIQCMRGQDSLWSDTKSCWQSYFPVIRWIYSDAEPNNRKNLSFVNMLRKTHYEFPRYVLSSV
ncbi:hypothetical protein Patl1_07227 [Pistacia atlantica]|uniref:Uncharacterized protein n=1 Tax=Pistacia atlantica TaxID=434234 RepID=A0ACC1AH75_9ROSI|nr:hypothetical protein Patl1_07227 [Pistacia atlantica]